MSSPTMYLVSFNMDHFRMEMQVDFNYDPEINSWKEIALKADKLIKEIYGFSPLAMSNDFSCYDNSSDSGV
jgi:hypothetical protein